MPLSPDRARFPSIPESDNVSLAISWPVEIIWEADERVAAAAREIRGHYYRQLRVLREIPYLALEADGRGGWSDEYNLAYNSCMMAVHRNERGDGCDLAIELRTGELFSVNQSGSTYVIIPEEAAQFRGSTILSPADYIEVFAKLAHPKSEGEIFDPAREIIALREGIKRPYHNKPAEVADALERKRQKKLQLDQMMANIPIEDVRARLRLQGFDL